jgi:hypothetical protein
MTNVLVGAMVVIFIAVAIFAVRMDSGGNKTADDKDKGKDKKETAKDKKETAKDKKETAKDKK